MSQYHFNFIYIVLKTPIIPVYYHERSMIFLILKASSLGYYLHYLLHRSPFQKHPQCCHKCCTDFPLLKGFYHPFYPCQTAFVGWLFWEKLALQQQQVPIAILLMRLSLGVPIWVWRARLAFGDGLASAATAEYDIGTAVVALLISTIFFGSGKIPFAIHLKHIRGM